MTAVEQSIRIPATGVTLDADIVTPRICVGRGAVRARQRQQPAQPAQPLRRGASCRAPGWPRVLVDLLTPEEERADAADRPAPVRHRPARRPGDRR